MNIRHVTTPYEALIRYGTDGRYQGASLQQREFFVDDDTGNIVGGELLTDPRPITREELAELCGDAAAIAVAQDAHLRAALDAATAELAAAREAHAAERERLAAEVAALREERDTWRTRYEQATAPVAAPSAS